MMSFSTIAAFLLAFVTCVTGHVTADSQFGDSHPQIGAILADDISINKTSATEHTPAVDTDDGADARAATDGLSFLILGDWGRNPTDDSEDGGKAQARVAAQMARAAAAARPPASFVLALGDNFYWTGVDSTNDPRWDTTFEKIYGADGALNVPFYAIAGNHDACGNVTAQIAYTGPSGRWRMPGRHYEKFVPIAKTGQQVHIVFVDTNIVDAVDNDVTGGGQGQCGHTANDTGWKCNGDVTSTPAAIAKCKAGYEARWKAQQTWLAQALSAPASRGAAFRVVVGHHPIGGGSATASYTIRGARGAAFLSLLETASVDAYVSGHVHFLSHRTHTYAPGGSGGGATRTMHLFVSGSGGGFQRSGDMPSLGVHPSAEAFQDQYGFLAATVSANTMTLSMVGEHGERPYNATLTSTTMG